jgi:DNA-binding transcriptional ArsR family regulator
MAVHHPTREQIQLESLFAALANPLRLNVVRALAAGGEHPCGSLLHGVSKSTLTHHWRVLREGGLIRQRPVGRELLLSLRREDLDARFPGLLDSVLEAIDATEPAEAGAAH